MKRRTMIQSGIGGLAAAFSASAFASTKLKGNEKMMPVDTLNHEPGWDKEPVEVLEIKGVRIGEGRPKIIASTTALRRPKLSSRWLRTTTVVLNFR